MKTCSFYINLLEKYKGRTDKTILQITSQDHLLDLTDTDSLAQMNAG